MFRRLYSPVNRCVTTTNTTAPTIRVVSSGSSVFAILDGNNHIPFSLRVIMPIATSEITTVSSSNREDLKRSRITRHYQTHRISHVKNNIHLSVKRHMLHERSFLTYRQFEILNKRYYQRFMKASESIHKSNVSNNYHVAVRYESTKNQHTIDKSIPSSSNNHLNESMTNLSDTFTSKQVENDRTPSPESLPNDTINTNSIPLIAITKDRNILHTPATSSWVVVKHWIQQLQSIPNMITVSRIILIPIISYWIISQQVLLAFFGCIYAAISDVLDGYIARKYPSMQTPLGTYLDPLADKFFINTVSISLWINGTLPLALVGLWLVRDVVLMIATHQYVAQNTSPGMAVMDPVTVPMKVIPTTISKVNTALQFITLVAGIATIVPSAVTTTTATALTSLAASTSDIVVGYDPTSAVSIPDYWYEMDLFADRRIYVTETILPALCWITGGTTIASSFSYYGHSAFKSITKLTTVNKDPSRTNHTLHRK